MKNYKILENRPQLTKAQLSQGMDFLKVKTNATIVKSAILKSIIIKSIIGVAVIGSGILVYNKAIFPANESKTISSMDTLKNMNPIVIDSNSTIDNKSNESIINIKNEIKKPSLVSNTSNDTSSEFNTSNKTINPISLNKDAISDIQVIDSIGANQEIKNSQSNSQKITKSISVKSCKIWNTNNFCDFPKLAKFATSLDCDLVDFDYIDCQTVNQKNNLVAVWLTINSNGKSSFQIESSLKNIRHVNAKGKAQNPIMIGISGDDKFLGPNFKARKMTVNYNKQIDVFLLFPNAKPGEKIIINNLIEALIEN